MKERNIAKRAVIANISKQREVLLNALVKTKRDGDPTLRYVGFLFPENRAFFEKEGFVITTAKSSRPEHEGFDINIFVPNAEAMVLTGEEMAEAEAICDFEISSVEEMLEDFMKHIQWLNDNKEDDEDEDDEDEDDEDCDCDCDDFGDDGDCDCDCDDFGDDGDCDCDCDDFGDDGDCDCDCDDLGDDGDSEWYVGNCADFGNAYDDDNQPRDNEELCTGDCENCPFNS